MRTVFKYPFRVDDRVVIRLPLNFEVLHVAVQDDQPCLWALVDTDEPSFDREFRIFGTGHEVLGVHDATFFEGPFVWHLFRV
jgi:hypothetical protein